MNIEENYFDFSMEPGKSYNESKKKNIDKQEPLISIITAYYNSKEYINQTANSVLNQTFPFWEWIIVNDGSTEEGTKEILEKLEKRDSRIKIIHQDNKGRLVARDRAMAETRAEIIFMLDSDDLLDKTILECGYWTLYTNKEATWAYTNCVTFGDVKFLYKPYFNSERQKKENLVIGSSFIRKKNLIEVGGYNAVDKDVHEDWHLWLRMLEKGWYPIRMNFYGFWYRRRNGSTLDRITKTKEEHSREVIKRQAKKIRHYVNAIQYPVNSGEPYKTYPKCFEWTKKPIYDKSKKNLLFIFPWFVFGGADKFNYDLISRLDGDKYNITIITTEPSDYIWRQKFEPYAEVYDLTTFLHRKYWSSFIHYIIKSREIDLVMLSNSYYGYYVAPWLKAEFPNVIFIDYIHAHDWSWRNGGYPRDSIAISNILDKTYTCNNFVKDIMVNNMGGIENKIETMYVGVDTDEFDPERICSDENVLEKIGNRKVILYICRIVELKRPIFMLRVLKEILLKDNNFVLIVVGDGEQLQEMKEYAKIFNIEDNVIFEGMQSEVKKYYKVANVTVICSLTEGLTITTYESLSMGVPVITADIGGQKELVDDKCGRVIKNYQTVEKDLFNRDYSEKEIHEYVEAILNIVNSKNYKNIKKACRNKVTSKFSTKDMINKMDEQITKMIESGTNINREILNNKELFKQYLVLYNVIDNRIYNTDIGGIESKEYINKIDDIEEKLWASKLYRMLYKFCKKTGIVESIKKTIKLMKRRK